MNRTRRITTAVAASAAVALQLVVQDDPAAASAAIAATTHSVPIAERPANNNCSGGYVTYAFDDRPRESAGKAPDAFNAFGIDAAFFSNGQNEMRLCASTGVRQDAAGSVLDAYG